MVDRVSVDPEGIEHGCELEIGHGIGIHQYRIALGIGAKTAGEESCRTGIWLCWIKVSSEKILIFLKKFT